MAKNKTRKQKKTKKVLAIIFAALFYLAMLGVVLYPMISNLFADDMQSKILTQYEKQIESRGIRKEECVSGGIHFMLTDGRYIMIWAGDSTGDGGVYENLNSGKPLSREAWDDGACTGVGLIATDDFVGGKDVEIRQIY